MFVRIKPDEETNQGRPLQVLIRSVSVDAYRSESYTALARLVIEPDKSVLRLVTIEPRRRASRLFYIGAPSKVPVAIYFFYVSSIGNWKMLLPPPLPFTVTVPLGPSGVKIDAVGECCQAVTP